MSINKKILFVLVFLIYQTNVFAVSSHKSKTYSLKSTKLQNIDYKLTVRRRITSLEKNLLKSNKPRKIRLHNRTIIIRKIFKCSKLNIEIMLKGKAPLGIDGKKVNLHHMKQQKNGELVELTETEHTQHNKILHRYNRNKSNITDRNSEFKIFRNKYWKKQALSCITGSR